MPQDPLASIATSVATLAQQQQSDWAAFSVIISALSAGLALCTVLVVLFTSRRNKRTDVLVEVHRRFDALMLERARLERRLQRLPPGQNPSPGLIHELRTWSMRFWSLQFDQYEWWQSGHVDLTTYCYWMLSRRHEHETADARERLLYDLGWAEIETRWVQHVPYAGGWGRVGFITLMEAVRTGTEPVPILVLRSRPGLLRGLGLA
jgi:hypothetical protein